MHEKLSKRWKMGNKKNNQREREKEIMNRYEAYTYKHASLTVVKIKKKMKGRKRNSTWKSGSRQRFEKNRKDNYLKEEIGEG